MKKIDDIFFDDKEFDKELDKLNLSTEDKERLKHERAGRILMYDADIFNTVTGDTEKLNFLSAIIKIILAPNMRLVTSETRPMYGINNKYMGYSFGGKIYNPVKKMKKLRIKKYILAGVVTMSSFLIGIMGGTNIMIMYVIAMMSMIYFMSLTFDELLNKDVKF